MASQPKATSILDVASGERQIGSILTSNIKVGSYPLKPSAFQNLAIEIQRLLGSDGNLYVRERSLRMLLTHC
jgi:hypothetical protein